MPIKMKFKNFITIIIGCFLLCILYSSAWAEPRSRAELWLQKEDPYLYGGCGSCTDLFKLKEDDNRKDLRLYNLDTQTGYFLIDLIGPVGTIVTLYGSQNYGLKNGYLILVKKDDRPIAVGDLWNLPSRQWLDVGTSETGIYSLWYQPVSNFKERISSVRWGKWWSELPPASEKE